MHLSAVSYGLIVKYDFLDASDPVCEQGLPRLINHLVIVQCVFWDASDLKWEQGLSRLINLY